MSAVSFNVSGDKERLLRVMFDNSFLHLIPGEGKGEGAASSPARQYLAPAVYDSIRQPLVLLSIY